LAIFLLASSVPVFADEAVEVYKLLYTQAETQRQKFIALKVMVDMNDPVLAIVLAAALKDLLTADTKGFSAQDADYYDKMLILTCQGLGNFLYDDSQDDLMFVVRNNRNPQIRSEALIALGKMRALAYLDDIVGILRDLNANSGTNREEAEILANGCLISLGKMGDIKGWTEVFFASQGWYSNRIRFTAEEILPAMVDDPSPAISEILSKESVKLKILALRYEVRSKASRENRIRIGQIALREGIASRATNASDKALAKSLRTAAMDCLISQNDASPDSLAMYKGYWPNADMDERLLILSAYGVNKGNEAAALLSEVITECNLQKTGNAFGDDLDRLTKAAILNAAKTRNPAVIPALKVVASNPAWSSGMTMAASDALKELGAK
jgi:hypothetical protein